MIASTLELLRNLSKIRSARGKGCEYKLSDYEQVLGGRVGEVEVVEVGVLVGGQRSGRSLSLAPGEKRETTSRRNRTMDHQAVETNVQIYPYDHKHRVILLEVELNDLTRPGLRP